MLNAIVVNFKDNQSNAKFPKGHLAQINRKYKTHYLTKNGKSNLSGFRKISIHQSSKISRNFIHKDSTKAYVYLEKENPILLMVL
jgi:hypothetical protein